MAAMGILLFPFQLRKGFGCYEIYKLMVTYCGSHGGTWLPLVELNVDSLFHRLKILRKLVFKAVDRVYELETKKKIKEGPIETHTEHIQRL